MRSFIEPIQSAGRTELAGTASATGQPRRITRIDFFVFSTSASRAKHFALNSDTVTSLIATALDHSPTKLVDYVSAVLRQPERVHCAARRDRHTFLSVHGKRHRRRIDRASHLEMPQRLT